MAELRLGINNAFAAKRWPEPHAWALLLADIGLREVQFSFDLIDPLLAAPSRSERTAHVKQAAEEHGLHLRTTFTGATAYEQSLFGHPDASAREGAKAWYDAAVDLTAELGAEATGGHMGTISVETSLCPSARAHARRRILASVTGLARTARAHGLAYILWELMPSALEPPHCPEEAEDMLAEANAGSPIPIRLCLDLGHCCAPELGAPGDPESWLDRLLPWVRMIHLQQTDGIADRHWPFVEPHNRDGIIHPKRIIELARESREEAIDLVFELIHPMTVGHTQVVDEYKKSAEQWKRCL